MRKTIPRIQPYEFPDTDGWFLANAEGGIMVLFRAAGIQGYGKLTAHSIDANGEVDASVLIRGTDESGNPAEYHEFVTLEDWDRRMTKRAGDEYVTIAE